MQYNPANPLIVQGDRTVLLEVDNPKYAEARDALAPFAELEKSPEHIHTYRLSPLSLWNAAAAGMTAEAMIEALSTYSKFPLPPTLAVDLAELVGRYGTGPPGPGRWLAPAGHQRQVAARRTRQAEGSPRSTSASGSTRPASRSTTASGASSSRR